MVPVPSRCSRGVAQAPKFSKASSNYGTKPRTLRSIWVTHAARAAELGTLHTVQTGETLAQIALAYGVSVDQIQAVSKPGRRRRGSLRSDEILQPGQKLIVNSEKRQTAHSAVASTSGPAAIVPRLTLPHIHTPWLAACLGGALLAAGAVKVASTTTSKATAVSGRETTTTLPGPTAVEEGATTPAPAAPAVASALFEVRALLQDAAVEMHAVESALAAVRRAAAASRTAPHQTSQQQQPLVKEESQFEVVPISTAPPAPGAIDSRTAVSPADIATDKVVVTADVAAISASFSSSSSSGASAAASGTLTGTETLQPATPENPPAASTEKPLPHAETVAAVGETGTAVEIMAAADEMTPPLLSTAVAGTPRDTSSAAAAVVTETAAVPADPTSAAASLTHPTWSFLSAFDTAAQVAAARARVESALEAAYGIIRAAGSGSASTGAGSGGSPAASESDTEVEVVPVLAPSSPPLPPDTSLTAMAIDDGAAGINASAASEPVIESEVETAAVEAEGAVVVDVAAVVVPVVEGEVDPEPHTAVEVPVLPSAVAAEALGAGSGGSGLPMDAVAAGQVLDRIREINKLLEEQQRAGSAVISVMDDAATDLAADSMLATASPSPPPLVPYSFPAADADVASNSALEPHSREAVAAGENPQDEQQLQERAIMTAGGLDGGGPTVPGVGVVVQPSLPAATDPSAGGAESLSAAVPDPLPPSSIVAAASPSPPSFSSPPSPPPAPPVLSPGSQVTEALVGALTGSALSGPGGVGEALLERIRDIGKLLDESHTHQQAAAAALRPSTAPDLTPTPASHLAPPPPPALPTSPNDAVLPAVPRPPTPSLPADPPPPSPWDNKTLPYPPTLPANPQCTPSTPPATLLSLKTRLLDCVYGTARGVSASVADRAGVEELVCALEAAAPHASPTSALSCLGGSWKLLYTSAPGALMLLRALEGLPLVRVGDVVQTIHTDNMTATNKIELAVPMPVSLRAEAGLEVRSPRVFKVRFSRVGLDSYLATPTITTALELPDRISLLGAEIDLGPVRQMLLDPLTIGLEAAQGLLGRAVSPELSVESVPMPPGVSRGSLSEAASCWMLTTYLDDTLRISRDDEGRVYVMMKDVGMPRSGDGGSPQSPNPALSD